MSEVAVAQSNVVPIVDVDNIRLTVMTKEQAIENWDVLQPYLAPVFEMSAGRIDADDALKQIVDDLAEVLLIWDPPAHRIYAVIVAEAKIYPKKRVFCLGLCGGEHIHLWAEKMWPAIQAVARKKGFDQIEVTGRRGWKRFIPGAREIATFYAMDLDKKGGE